MPGRWCIAQFDRDVPNPWMGVTKKRRTMATKKAATREEVYTFVDKAIELGFPEATGAAVICFEWLQRPENVLAGYARWTDYRAVDAARAIRIEYHKTGEVVLHPLEEIDAAEIVQFYADAKAVIAQVPRRGVPMILKRLRDGTTKPYTPDTMSKVVRKVRAALGCPRSPSMPAGTAARPSRRKPN
jgi:hypothetical protein